MIVKFLLSASNFTAKFVGQGRGADAFGPETPTVQLDESGPELFIQALRE
jgi:hypothetical protein